MDGGSLTVPAVFSTLNATLRIASGVYELKAVGEQTRDLLDSTEHVSNSLQVARTIRRQKSIHLDHAEKKWIDDVLINTEKTLNNVAVLIEPARVDMQTKFGRIGFFNRGLFVFRDSPKVATNLSRLNLASQSLNAAMNILCTREGNARVSSPNMEHIVRKDRGLSMESLLKSPPTYEESEFLNRRRKSPASKRQTVVTTKETEENEDTISTRAGSAVETEIGGTGLGISESFMANNELSSTISARQFESCEEKIVFEPATNPGKVLPDHDVGMAPNHEGSDGLQVCDGWDIMDRRSRSSIKFNTFPGHPQWQFPDSRHGRSQQPLHQQEISFLGQPWQYTNAHSDQIDPVPTKQRHYQAYNGQQNCPSIYHEHSSPHNLSTPASWQHQHQGVAPSTMAPVLQHHDRQSRRLESFSLGLRSVKSSHTLANPMERSIHPSPSLQAFNSIPRTEQACSPGEVSPESWRSDASSSNWSATTAFSRPESQATNVGNRSRGRERRFAWLEYQSGR